MCGAHYMYVNVKMTPDIQTCLLAYDHPATNDVPDTQQEVLASPLDY